MEIYREMEVESVREKPTGKKTEEETTNDRERRGGTSGKVRTMEWEIVEEQEVERVGKTRE